MPAKVVRRSAMRAAPSGGLRCRGASAAAERSVDRSRRALAVLDGLDREIAAAGAAIAAGPDSGDTRDAVGVGDDTAIFEREPGAGDNAVVELLADRLHDRVGGEHVLARVALGEAHRDRAA